MTNETFNCRHCNAEIFSGNIFCDSCEREMELAATDDEEDDEDDKKNKIIIWFENHIAELQRQFYQDCEGDFERSEKQEEIKEAERMLEILKSL